MSRAWMLGSGLMLLALGGGVGYAVGARNVGSFGAAVEARASAGPVVATFVGGQIDAETLRARIRDEGPLMASTYATLEGRRELVQRMVREQVLLGEARRKGYHLKPSVARQCDGALLELFLESEFEESERRRPVTDAELEAYFASQKQALSRPAQVRLAHVFLAAPETDAASRERQRQTARALLAEARGAFARDPAAFAALARRRSDDPRTRPLGGELPMMSQDQLTQALGASVAKAAFASPSARGVLEQVVETPGGFQVVAVLEYLGAAEPKLDEARELIRPQLVRERRSKAYDAFVAGLERQAQIRVDEQALTSVATAPVVGPQGSDAR